jgi:hypothetical protein
MTISHRDFAIIGFLWLCGEGIKCHFPAKNVDKFISGRAPQKKSCGSQCHETPCLRYFFAGNDQQFILLYPNNGVAHIGFMFQFRLLNKKK